MSDRSCAACVFFDASFDGASYGLCRRGAPRFGPHGTLDGVWPEVDVDDWCGEFRKVPACGDPGCLDCAAHSDSVKKLTADIEAHLAKPEAAP